MPRLGNLEIFVLSALEFAILIPTLAVFVAKEHVNSLGERFILSMIELILAFLLHTFLTTELTRRMEPERWPFGNSTNSRSTSDSWTEFVYQVKYATNIN